MMNVWEEDLSVPGVEWKGHTKLPWGNAIKVIDLPPRLSELEDVVGGPPRMPLAQEEPKNSSLPWAKDERVMPGHFVYQLPAKNGKRRKQSLF